MSLAKAKLLLAARRNNRVKNASKPGNCVQFKSNLLFVCTIDGVILLRFASIWSNPSRTDLFRTVEKYKSLKLWNQRDCHFHVKLLLKKFNFLWLTYTATEENFHFKLVKRRKASALATGRTLSEQKLLCNHCQPRFSSEEISNFQLNWLRIFVVDNMPTIASQKKLLERLDEREENPAFKSLLLFHGSRTPRNVLFWANANGNYAEKYKHKQLVMHINQKNWKQLSVNVFQCFFTQQHKNQRKQNARCHLSHL